MQMVATCLHNNLSQPAKVTLKQTKQTT